MVQEKIKRINKKSLELMFIPFSCFKIAKEQGVKKSDYFSAALAESCKLIMYYECIAKPIYILFTR